MTDNAAGRPGGYAAEMMRQYTASLGFDKPAADAFEQLHLVMLRDMVDRLESILADEAVDRATAQRLIRTLIYGCLPHHAETEARIQFASIATDALARSAGPMPLPGWQPNPGG